MTENQFRSHFSQFRTNTQFLLLFFFIIKWPPAAILDDRKSLSIAFLDISYKYTIFFKCFHNMAAGGHFGWPKITFDRISRHFRSIRKLFFEIFHEMATCGHFGWPKITFDRISLHFRSICNSFFFDFFFTKWLPVTILDDRKSLSIAFLSISDQYATFFFHKMAAGGHFGCISRHFRSIRNLAAGSHFGWPKITFDRISRHFRSIPNLFFGIYFSIQNGPNRTSKMAAGGHFGSPIWAILDDRKSLLIAFLAISDLEVRFALSMAMPNMKLIGKFMTKLEIFGAFLYKMAARGHFVFPTDAKNHRDLVIWDLNGYVEYEFDWCICDKVMACTRVGVRRRRRRRKNIISSKFSNFGAIIILPELYMVSHIPKL